MRGRGTMAEWGTRLIALDADHLVLFDGHVRVLRLSTGAIVERWGGPNE
jgi:hypothetical protein